MIIRALGGQPISVEALTDLTGASGVTIRRDLADLTETIMGDAQAMEHAYSHVLGELWGAVVASAIVFVGSLFFCWQLAVAAFWSVPVAFAVLYITRGPMTPVFDRVRAEKVKVTEAVQETLDCVREIRATNQEEHYLEGLAAVIDREEMPAFVNAHLKG